MWRDLVRRTGPHAGCPGTQPGQTWQTRLPGHTHGSQRSSCSQRGTPTGSVPLCSGTAVSQPATGRAAYSQLHQIRPGHGCLSLHGAPEPAEGGVWGERPACRLYPFPKCSYLSPRWSSRPWRAKALSDPTPEPGVPASSGLGRISPPQRYKCARIPPCQSQHGLHGQPQAQHLLTLTRVDRMSAETKERENGCTWRPMADI